MCLYREEVELLHPKSSLHPELGRTEKLQSHLYLSSELHTNDFSCSHSPVNADHKKSRCCIAANLCLWGADIHSVWSLDRLYRHLCYLDGYQNHKIWTAVCITLLIDISQNKSHIKWINWTECWRISITNTSRSHPGVYYSWH